MVSSPNGYWDRQNSIARTEGLNSSTKAILYALNSCAGWNGTQCRMANLTLQIAAGVSDKTLRKVVKELVERGVIEVVRGSGRTSSLYTLHCDQLSGWKASTPGATGTANSSIPDMEQATVSTARSSSPATGEVPAVLCSNLEQTCSSTSGKGKRIDVSEFPLQTFDKPIRTQPPARELTADEAFAKLLKLVAKYDFKNEHERMRSMLPPKVSAAVSQLGGFSKFASVDQYSRTRILTAFRDAYRAA